MLNTLRQKIHRHRTIFTIVIVALILRLIAILHGYPYIFNVDEPAVVRSTLGLFHNARIDHFDWPHFNYYFNFIFYFIFIKIRGLIQILGFRNFIEPVAPILWNDPFIFYLISRILNAVLGALTVIPLYLFTKNILGEKTANLSGWLLALFPYHIFISHFTNTQQDVSLLFWVTWAIYFSYKAAVTLEFKHFIYSGLFFGLATGAKYNAILLALALPIFVFIEQWPNRAVLKRSLFLLFTAGVSSIFIFFATNYRIIQSWDTFWSYEVGNGFLWQLKINSEPLSWSEYGPFLFAKMSRFFADLGYTQFVLYFISPLIIIKKFLKGSFGKSGIYVLSAFVISLLLILYTAKHGRAGSHYFVPYFTLITFVASYALMKITIVARNKRLIFSAIFIPIALVASIHLLELVRKDTRWLSLQYYEKHRNSDQTSAFYYKGQDLFQANTINNLGIKKYEDQEMFSGDMLISEDEFTGEKYVLVEEIENNFRRGPVIYVYEIKN